MRQLLRTSLWLTAFTAVSVARAGVNEWTTLGPLGGNVTVLVAAPAGGTVYAGTEGGGVYKTTDGAATWTPANTGFPFANVAALAIDPDHPSTLYAGIEDGGAYKTTNGGDLWTPINGGLPGDDVSVVALAVDPGSTSTLYAGTVSDGVFKSPRSSPWRSIPAIPTSSMPAPTAPRFTRRKTVAPPGAVRGSSARSSIEPTALGVSRSIDGGATWAPLGGALPNVAFDLEIDPLRTSILYAGTVGGGVFQLEQAGCVSDAFTLCLDDRPGDRRFAVTVDFHTAMGDGSAGAARAAQLDELGTRRGGILWFFDRNNPEVLVKVLYGCGFNQRFWVFYAATTNVGFDLTVTDTVTGLRKSYSNPDGKVASTVTDTDAFAICAADGGTYRPGNDAAHSVEAYRANGSKAAPAVKGPGPACVSDATTLCLDDEPGDGRFRVTAKFDTRVGAGASGDARAVSLQPIGIRRGGILWFFGPTNPEVLVKVLDGCDFNRRFWVFYAATTNVGFTLEVEDTRSGLRRVFANPDGQPALPVADTAAFDTCDL